MSCLGAEVSSKDRICSRRLTSRLLKFEHSKANVDFGGSLEVVLGFGYTGSKSPPKEKEEDEKGDNFSDAKKEKPSIFFGASTTAAA